MGIKKVNKKDGKVVSVDAEENIDNKDFKKTLKVTWLCDDGDKSPRTPTILIYYDQIISKAILDKDDDFKNYVNPNSKHEVEMLGDPELKNLKKGDIIQVQRRGYFVCDVEFSPYNQSVGRSRPVVLISIPDGTAGSYGLPGSAQAQPSKGPEKKPSGKEGKKQGGGTTTPAPAKQGKGSPSPAMGALGGSNDGEKLNSSVTAQGDLVRRLKAEKAAKPEIDDAVKKLLALKAEFKAATGLDWKPGMTIPQAATAAPAATDTADALNASVAAQGDLVRKLKADKAAKPDIDEAVKKLLALKAEYKAATGADWKPGASPVPTKQAQPSAASTGGADGLSAAVTAQGDIVRKLKSEKAAKSEIDEAVKKLLSLKADYKAATGTDWKPGAAPTKPTEPVPVQSTSDGGSSELSSKVEAQGNLVRQLKGDKKPKEEIDAAVKKLLELKAEYKAATGSDWQPVGGAPKKQEKQKKAAAPKEVKAKEKSSSWWQGFKLSFT